MLSKIFGLSISFKIIGLIAVFNTFLFFLFLYTRSYPTYLMFIHFATIIILWVIIFAKTDIFGTIKAHNKEIVLVFLLIVLSLWIRLYKIDELSPGLWGDEIAVGTYAVSFIKQNQLPPFVLDHPYSMPVTYAIGTSVELLGHTVLALRLPIAVMGALTVGIFYILLRLYLPVPISILGALLMAFQYTQIVLSRLAYEPIPSLFFQVLTAIFLALYHKTKNLYYLLAVGLSLVGGLYTYLNFRPFAIAIMIITIYLIRKDNPKKYLSRVLLFFGIIFVAGTALVSFQFLYPQQLWSRASDISIFAQHYSPTEFVKEFWGNIYRTGTFPITGDPNPEHNPAGIPPFGPITIVLAAIGFIYLYVRKRGLFWVTFLLMFPPFVSDIFSIERISEFHYYGLGHPHALRISGWIAVILFAAAFGLFAIYVKGKKTHVKEITIALSAIVLISCFLNWNWYFNQLKVNPQNYYWNYYFHNAAQQTLINYLNQTRGAKVMLSQSLWDSDILGFQFFDKPGLNLATFQPVSLENCISAISKSDITAIDVTNQTTPVLQQLVATTDARLSNYVIHAIADPAYNVDHIILITKLGY